VLLSAACGGAESEEAGTQLISGPGYTFRAPASWEIERKPRTILVVRPEEAETVAVSTFRLARPFRPEIWQRAVKELDRVVRQLAERLSPDAEISAGRTERIAGRRARVYDIRYERAERRLVERVGFVLRGRREYQLLCRWDAEEPETGEEACAELFSSFRL
jgi:hypothetical protein